METDLPPEGSAIAPRPKQDEDRQAPIISLDEVRQKRLQLRQQQKEQAERRRKRERHAMQLQVLKDVLYEKRLDSADLMDMIKLGLVTDDEDLLPCRCRSRSAPFHEWESKYYASRDERREPDEDLLQQIHSKLAQGYDTETSRLLVAEHKKRLPEPTEVSCPLQAYEDRDGAPPPCAYVLRNRSKMEWDREREKLRFHPIPASDDDPVFAADMHPCAVLGRELYTTIMLPVWLRERDEGDEDE